MTQQQQSTKSVQLTTITNTELCNNKLITNKLIKSNYDLNTHYTSFTTNSNIPFIDLPQDDNHVNEPFSIKEFNNYEFKQSLLTNLSSQVYNNCIFTNSGFIDKLNNLTFFNCTFYRHVFYKLRLTNCKFINCKFIECSYASVRFFNLSFTNCIFSKNTNSKLHGIEDITYYPNHTKHLGNAKPNVAVECVAQSSRIDYESLKLLNTLKIKLLSYTDII